MRENPRFPIGTQFIPLGKNTSLHTVIDYYITRNLAGEIVNTKYVSRHTFLGQEIKNYDIAETTIARGLVGNIADFP